ncbi:MAG: SAM-dependent methyltransferase, partial [Bacteroidales bacterium]|nr:SAM-dependent methyltransferase [Bacteroidales bacterium]
RFLKSAGYTRSFDTVTFQLLNKHISETDSSQYLEAVAAGVSAGILSEAGCPCIADPGQIIVGQAHREGIRVVPLVGPSSILMALMASGMNGQSFVFNGYLPKQQHERIKAIRELESNSRRSGATQIFMETPFRNNQVTSDLLQACHPGTRLCIAADISTSNEYIRTYTIGHWRKTGFPDLNKRPAIFLISA